MAKLREDLIHLAIRNFLKKNNWKLIAGQYPNGSDDEVPSLNIMDPTLAKDNSPDHRRHSTNKIVPDIVASKADRMLIIEMKPLYSKEDEIKLEYLLADRIIDLQNALDSFIKIRNITLDVLIKELTFIPCLGFGIGYEYITNPRFCYFLVEDLTSVLFYGNQNLGYL